MQSIWARAAQAGCTCKCAFCYSTTALSHGSTSPALRRRVRFRDLFTMFYSTVLASAAVADTSRKDARLREWERLIQEARDELEVIEDKQRGRIELLLQTQQSNTPAARIHNKWGTLFDTAKQTMDDREALGFRELPGPPLNLLKQLNTSEIQELLSDPVIARLKEPTDCESAYALEPQALSDKKIRTIAWSVRKLAFRLLESSEKASVDRLGGALDGNQSQSRKDSLFLHSQLNPIRSQIDLCSEKLCFIRSKKLNEVDWRRFQSPVSPTYRPVVDKDTLSPNHYLHIALKEFKNYDRSNDQRIQKLLFDISGILLDSRLPPDINFFNNLIIWLTRLKRWVDVRAVIEAMRESHIRPNKMTLTLMLRFYTAIKDKSGFFDMTLRMKGSRGGLAIANPNLSRTHSVKWRYMVFEKHTACLPQSETDKWLLRDYWKSGKLKCRPGEPAGVTSSPRRTVPMLREVARMNCMDSYVYGALIDGALKFDEPKTAMTYYLQMIEDGWDTSIHVLGSFLDYCLRLQDWKAGVVVWRQICGLAEGASRAALSFMLELCRCHGKHVEFGEVLEYGVRNRVLPPTIWDTPEKFVEQPIIQFLRHADVAASSSKLTLKIGRWRNFFEHALEHLAYRIAKIALDIAELDPELGKSSTSFNVYIHIRQMHRDSPRALTHRKKESALQVLANRVEQNKKYRRDRNQQMESKKLFSPIEPWHKKPRKHDSSSARAILWERIPLDSVTTPSPATAIAENTTPSDIHDAAPSAQEPAISHPVSSIEPAPVTKEKEGCKSDFVPWRAYPIQDTPQPPKPKPPKLWRLKPGSRAEFENREYQQVDGEGVLAA
ncbi:MAG: hypothetical protein Q9191_005299 [Dirinaria sp. TL-2023a]